VSLIRQVWLLIVAVILLAFGAATLVSVLGARTYLEAQLTLKNSDNAQSLAMNLSQQGGNVALIELTLAAQFDTGAYQAIRLVGLDAKPLLVRDAEALHTRAPRWLVDLVPIKPRLGVAQVSSGWAALGRLEVESQAGFAYDELWGVAIQTALGLATIGAVAMLVGWLGVRRISARLDEVVSQAQALHERQYREVALPKTPELRRVAVAMNALVGRVRSQSEQHADEVEHLRRSAHDDRLTGVSMRSHFMIRLGLALQADDAAASGLFVLVRLLELADLNRLAGHAQADTMLRVLARTLIQVNDRIAASQADGPTGTALGRLNGSDFGLLWPASIDPGAVEQMLDLLRRALAPLPPAAVAVSVVGWQRGITPAELMAAADAVLARAEAQGPFAVQVQIPAQEPLLRGGEELWRYHLVEALAAGRGRLFEFAVRGPRRELLHLESPLRLQLEADGPWVPAAQWLPLALRTGLTPRADELALRLALAACRANQRPRGINLSPQSLRDAGLVPRLRQELQRQPEQAKLILIDVDQATAAGHTAALVELCRQLKPLGVRIGLEHAGERVAPVGVLLEAGLDFVKLAAGVVQGVARDEARAALVRGMVAMLHGLGLQVIAEGVEDQDDLDALWTCGLDGATGPAVR
jgi:EAL domain-containing protein (putative c-di-GMP-specific phosphodiesterase class I)/GGDEF domain-containing protein